MRAAAASRAAALAAGQADGIPEANAAALSAVAAAAAAAALGPQPPRGLRLLFSASVSVHDLMGLPDAVVARAAAAPPSASAALLVAAADRLLRRRAVATGESVEGAVGTVTFAGLGPGPTTMPPRLTSLTPEAGAVAVVAGAPAASGPPAPLAWGYGLLSSVSGSGGSATGMLVAVERAVATQALLADPASLDLPDALVACTAASKLCAALSAREMAPSLLVALRVAEPQWLYR